MPNTYSPTKRFFHQDGCFYQLTDDGQTWKKIECYMPSGTGTYGEPLEATMHRLFGYLESGKLKIKGSTESKHKYMMVDGALKRS